jgi:hypothetical protein|tara:strand:+ start:247 stop:480 length:234 start_codon:yes stop_codon:yes gene_type:complete
MKITLVQPKYFNIWESLGLAYIGSYLKNNFSGKLEINYFKFTDATWNTSGGYLVYDDYSHSTVINVVVAATKELSMV